MLLRFQLSVIFFFLYSFSDALLTQKQINHTSSIIQHLIDVHSSHLDHPLVTDEKFCRCTVDGCDEELVRLGGESLRGMCRARGGTCRQTVHMTNDGHIRTAVLDCITPENMHPPNRPLACENLKSSVSKDYILCCNQTSFCNDIDVPVGIGKPKQIAEAERVRAQWPWFLVLLFVVAIIFSAVGLLFGIFWFNSSSSKRFARSFLMRYVSKDSAAFLITNNNLNRLLDDLESQKVTVETGGPMLARRTIARQIHLKQSIARGRFGEVWLGEWRGEKVAVKIFHSRDELSWARETEIYSTNMLRHNNLLRWIASDNKDTGTSTQLWLISEYLPNGSLADYLEGNTLSMTEAVQFIRSLVHGLSYLHTEVPGISHQCYKPAIAHRDIKSRNILVKNDMTCAIADLGLAARNIHGTLDIADNGRGGTVRYLAPEYLNDTFVRHRFTSYMNMDMYAVGLVMWEIARRVRVQSGHKPPDAQVPFFEFVPREPTVEDMRQCVCVKKNRPEPLPEWNDNRIMREVQRLMTECWAESGSSRLTSLNVRYSLDKLVELESLKIMT